MSDQFPPLPESSRALLRRYQLKARERWNPNLSGNQLMRRRGQSLEFKEYMPYTPGDDVRHIDWRASQRVGGPNERLIRSFMAEEALRVVVSIDTRPTMCLPKDLPKLRIARWLAEAICRITLQTGDMVFLHRLFGGVAEEPWRVVSQTQVRTAVDRLQPVNEDDSLNIAKLRPYLPPTSVWLVVTDLYFETGSAEGRALASAIATMPSSYCWVILVDLNSWPFERKQLEGGVWRIGGPGGSTIERHRPIAIDKVVERDEIIAKVETNIKANKDMFFKHAHLFSKQEDYRRWDWEESLRPDGGELFFKDLFVSDTRIRYIFARPMG